MAPITPSSSFASGYSSGRAAIAAIAGLRMKRVSLIGGFALLLLAVSDLHAASSFGISMTISDTRSALSGRILGESDNGKTLTVHVGDAVNVDLPAHFGAGPGWRVVTQDLLGAPVVASAAHPNTTELQRFKFQAIEAGSTVLRLECRGKPYDEVKTFRATVRIEKP